MLILLPPSEGKAPSEPGTPLDLGTLALPALTRPRKRAFDALVKLCRGRESRATEVLGLSPGLRSEIARNAVLDVTGTRPAAEIYTGVVYDALDVATLSPDARALADESILISSALFGAVRLTDRIPPYRCSIGVSLPVLGGLAAYWKRALTGPVDEVAGDDLVLDLRSGAYAASWAPPRSTAHRAASVRVLHERGGVRTVVSHFNKATKGRLVREMLTSGTVPSSPEELVTALRDLKYTVEASSPAPGKPWRLDIIVTEL